MWVSYSNRLWIQLSRQPLCRSRSAPSQSEQRKWVHSGCRDPRISRVGAGVFHDTEAKPGDLGCSSAVGQEG